MPSRRHLSSGLVAVAAILVAGTMPRAESASWSPSFLNPAPFPAAHPHVASPSRVPLFAHARPRDTEPPVLTLTEPVEAAIVTTPTIIVRGTEITARLTRVAYEIVTSPGKEHSGISADSVLASVYRPMIDPVERASGRGSRTEPK